MAKIGKVGEKSLLSPKKVSLTVKKPVHYFIKLY